MQDTVGRNKTDVICSLHAAAIQETGSQKVLEEGLKKSDTKVGRWDHEEKRTPSAQGGMQ